MPPPVEDLSDEESGDIPFTTAPEDNKDAKNAEEANEDDDSGEEDEGVYIVEEIKGHEYKGNTLLLLVKWKGYEAFEDHTWEPEKQLQDGAGDVLNTYYKQIGGRPEKPKAPGRKRKSMAEKKETTATTPAETKRRRQSAPKADAKKAEDNASAESDDEEEPSDWVPKSKNWESEVKSVDTIIRDAKDDSLYALLHWTNGKRSRIHVTSCYENCPMKMLKFYEKHLVFKDG